MSPSEELQKAIYDRLVADAAVGDLVGDRIYDGPPTDAAMPYVSFGSTDWYEDGDATGCIAARVETVQIDCWSQLQGRKRGAKALVDAVAKALHRSSMTFETNALGWIRVTRTQVLDDPDGITAHGIVLVEASVEEVSA